MFVFFAATKKKKKNSNTLSLGHGFFSLQEWVQSRCFVMNLMHRLETNLMSFMHSCAILYLPNTDVGSWSRSSLGTN